MDWGETVGGECGEDSSEIVGVNGGCMGLGVCIGNGVPMSVLLMV